MIVRELLTLLGFTIDRASYDKASKAYDQMQGRLAADAKAAQQAGGALDKMGKQAQDAAKGTGMLGSALGMLQRFSAQAGISNLLREYTTLASDANETEGAIKQLFGEENLTAVQTWSETMGAAMGRSKYDLQKYAAGLGAVLGPVTESKEEAQAMAQSLSELAVDLGSFFNTSDEAAMQALRSGLTGEMESLKKYGIVINEATLQEVAHTKGIKKKVSQMTIAEKTELRYAAILERSSAAKNDAIRTSEGMANATKALKAQLKTLGIDAAKKVVPVIEKLVRLARDAVNWFNKMAKNTKILESAMYTLAGVAGVLALEFYGAFVLPALAVAALILVVDELWTTLEGGDTLMRDFIDGIFGDGATAAGIAALKAGLEGVRKAFEGLDAVGVWQTFRDGADNAGFAVERLIQKMIELLGWLNPTVAAIRLLKKAGTATGLLDDDSVEGRRAMGQGMGAREAETISDELELRMREQRANIVAGVEQRKAERAERARTEQYGPRSYSAVPSATEPSVMGGEGYGVLRMPVPEAAGGGPAPVVVPVNTAAPTINISTSDPATVERVVKRVLADDRKANMAAVGRRGGS